MKAMALLLLLAAVLAAFGLTPFPGSDISDLDPVELLVFTAAEGGVTVGTESGLAAWGRDIPQALEKLRRSASGHLFLETVDQVVFTALSPQAKVLLDCGLRPGTAVYCAPPVEDAKALNKYLQGHTGRVTLGKLHDDPAAAVPDLIRGESGLYIL